MNQGEVAAWAERHHGLGGPAWRACRRVLELAEGSAPRTEMATAHFQACLNSRDLFRIVKLVHVAEPAPGRGESVADARRSAVLAMLDELDRAGLGRFDAAEAARVYDAVLARVPGWFPVMGFEFSRESTATPELSLYCELAPVAAAEAALEAWALGRRGARTPEGLRLHAAGLDFLAGGGSRVKLYLDASGPLPPEAAAAAEALRECLGPGLAADRVLLLRRTSLDGGLEPGWKAYAALPSRLRGPGKPAGCPTACTGPELVESARGRLRDLARAAAGALEGQSLFYVSLSEEKAEAYFGKGDA